MLGAVQVLNFWSGVHVLSCLELALTEWMVIIRSSYEEQFTCLETCRSDPLQRFRGGPLLWRSGQFVFDFMLRKLQYRIFLQIESNQGISVAEMKPWFYKSFIKFPTLSSIMIKNVPRSFPFCSLEHGFSIYPCGLEDHLTSSPYMPLKVLIIGHILAHIIWMIFTIVFSFTDTR